MKSPHRLAAAAALTLALAGCAGAGANVRSEPLPGSKRVGVQFKGACPVDLDIASEDQCGSATAKRPRCVEVYRAKPAVHFVAVQTDPDPKLADLDLAFSLDFDPFHTGNNPFKGKKGQLIQLAIDPGTPMKEYTFNVLAPGCDPLDPQIVVR